jgi:hypothetical protein
VCKGWEHDCELRINKWFQEKFMVIVLGDFQSSTLSSIFNCIFKHDLESWFLRSRNLIKSIKIHLNFLSVFLRWF